MTCPQCGGTGTVPHWGALPDTLECPECVGGRFTPASVDDRRALLRVVTTERFGSLDELERERRTA